MKKTDLCILISTFPDCWDIAEFTASRIRKFWPDHPEIVFCGLERRAVSLWHADWMTILLEACDVLWQKGVRKIYLILDDHPPLGPCHSLHLNQTLPRVLEDLEAVNIALLGMGQGRAPYGTKKKSNGFTFDHVDPKQLWKFTLHPALWNLEILRELLHVLIQSLSSPQRTPWAFERWAGAADAPLPMEWKSGCYRILGRAMKLRSLHPLFLMAKRPLRGLELLAEVFGKGAIIRRPFGFIRHFYDGPYPVIWSGLMKKKNVNPDFLFYSRMVAKKDFIENLPPRFLRTS